VFIVLVIVKSNSHILDCSFKIKCSMCSPCSWTTNS